MPTYNVTVKPGSSQQKITKLGDALTVYLHAKPTGGEANTALIELLAKHFRVPKTTITIVRGAHSHRKVISF